MNSIETQVLRLIGENITTPDVFADTDEGMALIRDSVNQAIQEITMVTGSYTKVYHLHLFEGRQFYRVSSFTDYLIYPVLVWDREQKLKLRQTDLIRASNDDHYWMQNEGPPKEYMILGHDHLGIIHVPSQDGRILEMTWVCAPKEYVADTDPIKLREVFQRATAYYSVGEYYASRGDASRATEWNKKYLETASLGWMIPQPAERQFQVDGGRRDGWRR
jgi:hypothetical protein